jgi:hypothetical protein
LSLLALTRGDWENGEMIARDVLDIAQDIGSAHYEGWGLRLLEIAKSMARVARRDRVSADTITPFEVVLFHLLWSDEPSSNEFKRRIQRGFKAAGHDRDRARCLPFAALRSASTGDHARAVTLLGLAHNLPEFQADWVSRLPLVSELVAALKASLPPDAYAAAWERGRALNLAEAVTQILAEA